MTWDEAMKAKPGWRVPTKDEMSCILSWYSVKDKQYGYLELKQITKVDIGTLWTSTLVPNDNTQAIVLSLPSKKSGNVFRDIKALAAYVREYTP